MKVRIGFVSNSSTSSFCIFGEEVTFDDLVEKLGIKVPEKMEMEGCWHSYDKRHNECPQCGAPKRKEVDWEEYVDNYGKEEAYMNIAGDALKEHGLQLHYYNDEYGDGGVFVGWGVGGTGQKMIDELIAVNESIKKFFGHEASTHRGTYAC